MGCARRGFAALAFIAGAIPFAVLALLRAPGEDWWASAALVYAPKVPWIAAPAVGVLAALIARRRGLIVLNLAAAACAVFPVAGYQLNAAPPIPDDRPIIRLATWNVYGWTRDLDLVRDRIMAWDCDVVCLQESARSVFRDLLPGYESAVAGDLRVFVRGRIVGANAPPDPLNGRRRILVVEAETDAGPLTVINVHIPRAERARRTPREPGPLIEYIEAGVEVRESKFAQLASLLPAEGPLVVAGDMNTPPASRYYRMLQERLTDSFAAVGRGFGHTFVWRERLPLLRIDYVWAGGGVEPLRCRTEAHSPSDHRPVVVELALPRERRAAP